MVSVRLYKGDIFVYQKVLILISVEDGFCDYGCNCKNNVCIRVLILISVEDGFCD